MVSMDTSIQLKSALQGGILQGLSRVFLQGEDAFLSCFTAETGMCSTCVFRQRLPLHTLNPSECMASLPAPKPPGGGVTIDNLPHY